MRYALVLLAVLAAATAAAALVAVRSEPAEAAGIATLHVTGLDIGKKESAIVRLHNTSTHASDVFSVHYTVFAHDTLFDNPVALSLPGAGNGAQLRAGDTLELDLGEIVAAYRARQGAGTWDAPIRFVAFGTGGNFERFGPETIVAEALQTRRGATYQANVHWVDE